MLQSLFEKLFGKPDPEYVIVRSPGRINLIGEHTDYNGGFVFPAAIDKAATFIAQKNNVNQFRFHAKDLNQSIEISLSDLKPLKNSWANYLLGVAHQFQKQGIILSGVDCLFSSEIPIGAGLSSSAAIENGFALVLQTLFQTEFSKLELVKFAQKAEHEFAGVQCGIMDQFASFFGKENHAIKLDTQNLDFEYAPLIMNDYAFVLCDTNVKHNLASSEYNTRRQECQTGVTILKKYKPEIQSLRDVKNELLDSHKLELLGLVYDRCNYIINENKRVLKAFNALKNNKLETFGELMNQSHYGLRDQYQVSCKELDILQTYAEKKEYVLGSRMMGGGFGGCTINLVKKQAIENFTSEISSYYKAQTNIELKTYVVNTGNGTEIMNK